MRCNDNTENLLSYFENNHLKMNVNKTQFLVFSKPSLNSTIEGTYLQIFKEKIVPSSEIKILGVKLDRNLTFELEVGNVLRKMSCGIRTLQAIRHALPQKIRMTLVHALVLSHLQYSILTPLASKGAYKHRLTVLRF